MEISSKLVLVALAVAALLLSCFMETNGAGDMDIAEMAMESGLCAALTVFLILLGIAGAVCWKIWGRGAKLTPVVSVHPPEGLDPAQVGYILDGAADPEELASLITYWAGKGLLTIRQDSVHGVVIKRTRLLPAGSPEHQRIMWCSLFARGDYIKVDMLSKLPAPETGATFADEAVRAGLVVEADFSCGERQIFTDASAKLRRFLALAVPLPSLATVAALTAAYGAAGLMVAIFAASFIVRYTSKPIIVFLELGRKWHTYPQNERRRKLIINLLLMGASFLIPWAAAFIIEGIPVGILLLSLAVSIELALLTVLSRRRTEYGQRIMEELLGFRNFLYSAEKGRMEALFAQDQDYFYKILPYAYVMGVTKIWAKNFASLAGKAPEWYSGPGAFEVCVFAQSVTEISREITMEAGGSGRLPDDFGDISFGGE